ncbi:decapping endonuclease targeting mRNA [Dispira simplex]|nr:decapping endonuclease targeting mRNA [Dispira simplex]
MESSVKRLTVPSAAELRGPFPSYHQPKEILSFSLDDERRVHYDDRGLSCYFPAPIGTCLFDRADTFKARDVTKNEHIDNILQALVHAKRDGTLLELRQPQFVTFRGIMTKILYLPYNTREEWELGATRYNGTIYLEERLTDRRLQEPFRNRQQKLLMYSGYRFETMSTVPVEPDQLSGSDDPVVGDRFNLDTNNCAEFNSLFKTRLGKHSILMGAEVDCVSHGMHKEGRTDRYLELKTSRILTSRQSEENFER